MPRPRTKPIFLLRTGYRRHDSFSRSRFAVELFSIRIREASCRDCARLSRVALDQRNRGLGKRHRTCLLRVSYSQPHRQPRDASQHPTPAQHPYHGSDLCVVVEHAEAGKDFEKIMLHEVRIPGRDQRQHLGSSVSHVSRGIEPVLEKEKQAENETSGLAFGEEICRQQKRDQPLQQRASPQAQRGTKPVEKIVSAPCTTRLALSMKRNPPWAENA